MINFTNYYGLHGGFCAPVVPGLGEDIPPVPSSVPAAEAALVVSRLVAERDEWKETSAAHAANVAKVQARCDELEDSEAFMFLSLELLKGIRKSLEEANARANAELDALKRGRTTVKWAVRDKSRNLWLEGEGGFNNETERRLYDSKDDAKAALRDRDANFPDVKRGRATFVKVRVKA